MTAPTKQANFTVTHDSKRTVTVHQESVDFDPVAPVISFGVGLLGWTRTTSYGSDEQIQKEILALTGLLAKRQQDAEDLKA